MQAVWCVRVCGVFVYVCVCMYVCGVVCVWSVEGVCMPCGVRPCAGHVVCACVWCVCVCMCVCMEGVCMSCVCVHAVFVCGGGGVQAVW